MFSYEFILGSVVIGSSLIYESIPSCLYIVLAMAYLRYSVFFDKSSILIKLIISACSTLIAFSFCVAKGFIVYLKLYKASEGGMNSGPKPPEEL
jgi:hypothetical protein